MMVQNKNRVTVFNQSCIAKPAPDPSDIIWENLCPNTLKVYRRKIFLFVAISLIFLLNVKLKQKANIML